MTTGFQSHVNVDPASDLGKRIEMIFLILGLVLLALAVLLLVLHTVLSSRYIKTEAVITALDREGRPTLEYRAGGRTVVRQINATSTDFFVGKRIKITYNPDAPQTVMVFGFLGYLAPLILGFLGTVFSLIGGLMLRKFHGKGKKQTTDLPEPWTL